MHTLLFISPNILRNIAAVARICPSVLQLEAFQGDIGQDFPQHFLFLKAESCPIDLDIHTNA